MRLEITRFCTNINYVLLTLASVIVRMKSSVKFEKVGNYMYEKSLSCCVNCSEFTMGKKVNTSIPAKNYDFLIFSASNITIYIICHTRTECKFSNYWACTKWTFSVWAIGLHLRGGTVTSCWTTGRANWIYNT